MSPYVIPGIRRAEPINKESILAAVQFVTSHDFANLNVRNRSRTLVTARQMYFFFMKKYTNITWHEIARTFRMDHTTAIHAVNKIHGFIEIKDPHTLKTIGEIEQFLKNH